MNLLRRKTPPLSPLLTELGEGRRIGDESFLPSARKEMKRDPIFPFDHNTAMVRAQRMAKAEEYDLHGLSEDRLVLGLYELKWQIAHVLAYAELNPNKLGITEAQIWGAETLSTAYNTLASYKSLFNVGDPETPNRIKEFRETGDILRREASQLQMSEQERTRPNKEK